MTVQSATVVVNTQGTFETVESLTSITFASGKVYTIQIINAASLKLGDAIFELKNQIIQYKPGTDTLYIKSGFVPCTIAIYEDEE